LKRVVREHAAGAVPGATTVHTYTPGRPR
jgi:hypothetical protein